MIEWIFSSCVLILIVLLVRQIFKEKVSACFRYSLWLIVLLRLLIPFSLPGTGMSVNNLLSSCYQAFVSTHIIGEGDGNVFVADSLLDYLPMQEHPGTNGAESEYANLVAEDNLAENTDVNINGQSDKEEQKQSDVQYVTGQMHNESIPDTQVSFPKTDNLISNIEQEDFRHLWNVQLKNVLYGIWLFGVCVFGIVIFLSNFIFYKRLKNSRMLIQEGLSLHNQLPVYQSELIHTPCMFGIIQPAIYIRKEHEKVGLPYILRHENMHFKHKDHIWSVLRSLCLIIHWYNPFVWLSVYLSIQDAEFACDESIIKTLTVDGRNEYGKTLISLSVKTLPYHTLLSCASTLSCGKAYMRERISRIAKSPKTLIIPAVLVVLICGIAVGMTFTGSKGKNDTVTGEEIDSFVMENTVSDVVEPMTEPTVSDNEEKVSTVFLNDYYIDFNGDGIKDVLRVNAIAEKEKYRAQDLNTKEELMHWMQTAELYYEMILYDGVKVFVDENTFVKGMELSEEAIVSSGDSRIFALNVNTGTREYLPNQKMQLSFYKENDKTYVVANLVEMQDGAGYYTYMVMSCNENWEEEVIDYDTLTFAVNADYAPSNGIPGNMNFSEFAYKYFPYNDMLTYTLELESHLKKSDLIVDTINDESLTPVWYDEAETVPDVYDIWNWNPLFYDITTYEEFKPLLLEYAETVVERFTGDGFIEYEAINYQGWPVWGMKDVKYYYVLTPDVSEPAYEYANIPSIYWNKLPDSAKSLPAYVVEKACADTTTHLEDSIWEDWKITEIKWHGTYVIDGIELDIYSYDYVYKLDQSMDREAEEVKEILLWCNEQEDGWFAENYWHDYIIYDHNQDIYFTKQSNDFVPGDTGFTSDLIIYYKENFMGGFSYEDPENVVPELSVY